MSTLKLVGRPCEKSWGDLTLTNTLNTKFCETCDRRVYRAETVASLVGYVNAGQCVSVPGYLARNIRAEGEGGDPCVITRDEKTPVRQPGNAWAFPTFMGRVDVVKRPETRDEALRRNQEEDLQG